MGFGQLLIGYTVAYLFSLGLGGLQNYAFAGFIIGYFLCYLGLSKLNKYTPVFNLALIFSIVLTVCAFFETVVAVDNLFALGMGLSSSVVYTVFSYVRFTLDLAFNIALLLGAIDISKRVDYDPTRNMAYRNIVFVAIAYAFEIVRMILTTLNLEAVAPYAGTLAAISVILRLFYILLNVYLWFKSYAFICPAEDIDMKRKKSRFEFINKIHERNDKKEQENMELSRKYLEDKLKKRNEKRASGKKKKKK